MWPRGALPNNSSPRVASRVNGAVVTELGARADTESDRIDVDGKPVAREDHVYYLMHKPRGMVTTLKDPEDRPSLSELLHNIPERVYPVGRLDFHTSGALLLTNDGDLAQALLHPSRAVPKTYVVKVSVEVGETMLGALERGVVLDDGYTTQPAFVEHIRDEDEKSWIQITITEGKNRQIHRMIEALGARVMRLSRISFAGLSTEDLRPGEIRPLDRDELSQPAPRVPQRDQGRRASARRARYRRAHARAARHARQPERRRAPAAPYVDPNATDERWRRPRAVSRQQQRPARRRRSCAGRPAPARSRPTHPTQRAPPGKAIPHPQLTHRGPRDIQLARVEQPGSSSGS